MFNRADAIDEAFLTCVGTGNFSVGVDTNLYGLKPETLVDLFDTQLMSRHLDLMARRSKGKTFYSIGSSGHEGMAAMALASRQTDMAFLHYRDAAFLIHRLKQAGGTPLYDMALSFAASKKDPVSGGRHKVLGSKECFVPPQTSTIASHLPKAVGAAHSIGMANKLKTYGHLLPRDGVIFVSFGDASANHSTAQGAFNAACWASYQGAPMPIIFVCEDNNIGISVETPEGWIENSFKNRPGLDYYTCDGTQLPHITSVMQTAIDNTRRTRRPAFIHTKMIRLMGHAGADIEASYAPLKTIEQTEMHDPLIKTANLLVAHQILSQDAIIERYENMRDRVVRVATTAQQQPKLTSSTSVMQSIVPPKSQVKAAPAPITTSDNNKPLPLARHINTAISQLLEQYPTLVTFGEDVGRKGGVYGVTAGLQGKFGKAKVFDTLLDEQSILGLAIGMAHNGFVPMPEIQFLAYLHNAEDQLRGEAATLPFFSNGHYKNPMVIRIAGLAYQKGFGGHFHNDNSFAVLRDIPGVIIACPSNGPDAASMLRECVRLAYEENRVVIFLEPIALYNTQDLYADGDSLWLSPYKSASTSPHVKLGNIHTHGAGSDLTILTYGNGYYLSRKAEPEFTNSGISTSICDLRWLHPLPEKDILKAVEKSKRILIVDECRKTGSLSEQIITLLHENNITKPIARLTAEDSFIPLGPAAYEVLPSVRKILEAGQALCTRVANKKTIKKRVAK